MNNRKILKRLLVTLLLIASFWLIPDKSDAYRNYVPGVHPQKKSSFNFHFPLVIQCGGPAYQTQEKRILKKAIELLTMEIYYYGEVGKDPYPQNPQKLGFSAEKMKLDYLTRTDKELLTDWQCPETWDEFNDSEAPIIFLRSSNDIFQGSDKIPVFAIKPGYNARKDACYIIYEDGSSEYLTNYQSTKYTDFFKTSGIAGITHLN